MPGTFSVKMFRSASSSANTMRVCATGQRRCLANSSTGTVFAIASAILPPPNTAGFAKLLTKSMMSRPTGACGASVWPKLWRR